MRFFISWAKDLNEAFLSSGKKRKERRKEGKKEGRKEGKKENTFEDKIKVKHLLTKIYQRE